MIRTSDPNLFFDDLQILISREKIPVEGIDSPDDNLNAIFKYLVD